jgi:hypothetical protein
MYGTDDSSRFLARTALSRRWPANPIAALRPAIPAIRCRSTIASAANWELRDKAVLEAANSNDHSSRPLSGIECLATKEP